MRQRWGKRSAVVSDLCTLDMRPVQPCSLCPFPKGLKVDFPSHCQQKRGQMLLIKEMAHTELSVLQINIEKEKAMPLKNWLMPQTRSIRLLLYVRDTHSRFVHTGKNLTHQKPCTHTHMHMQCPELLKAPGEVP